MKKGIGTLVKVVVALVVVLPVTAAFADTIFLPLIAKASDGLAGLVRVEDNIDVSPDGQYVVFRTKAGETKVWNLQTSDVFVLPDYPWPEEADREWLGEHTLVIRLGGIDMACAVDLSNPLQGNCSKPPPPLPTPTEYPPPPLPTPTS